MSDHTAPHPATVRPRRGLTQKAGAVVLGFESVVVALGGLTIFGLRELPEGVAPWWAIVGGAVVSIAMIVTAGLLAHRWGIWLGWALQGVVALSALLVPAMLLVALVFGGMWGYAVVVGRRVDRAAAPSENMDSTVADQASKESE